MAGNAELLKNLHDIHPPDPVSWWPPAPGWWLIVGAVVIYALVTWWRASPARWRGEALRELQRIERELAASGDGARCIGQVSALLRRVVLTVREPAQVAALTGDAWLKLLDEIGDTRQFSDGPGRVLTTAPYARADANGADDIARLFALARAWLRAAR
jgi:hypothetical protein